MARILAGQNVESMPDHCHPIVCGLSRSDPLAADSMLGVLVPACYSRTHMIPGC